LVVQGDVPPALVKGLTKLSDELELPGDFPTAAMAEAQQLASQGPIDHSPRADMTDVAFVTIDPAGAKDLDQALFIERRGQGFRVLYAIVDLAAWIAPGGAIDQEARRRGQTFYAPQTRLPLHPAIISEGAASLLPDGVGRPANVWRIDLDADGAVTDFDVTRATVTSHAQLNYTGSQQTIDAGNAPDVLVLLKQVGLLRIAQEQARGGVSLNLPEQEVVVEGDHWSLAFRSLDPVESWNAQISLVTGFCAAKMMRQGGVGVLRTLPPVDRRCVDLLRHIARTLDIRWPRSRDYATFVRGLDPTLPSDQAMMNACTMLFRGAGYEVIGGADDTGYMPHGALASEYAHTTAPLRRLVDRFTGTICACLSSGQPVPDWVQASLPDLPATMQESDRRAKAFERGIIALTEALNLTGHEGRQYMGVIIETDSRAETRGIASIPSLAVEAPVTSTKPLELGTEAMMTLERADVDAGVVAFRLE